MMCSTRQKPISKRKDATHSKKRRSRVRQFACQLLVVFLLFLRQCFDSFINLIFSFIYEDKLLPLSPVSDKIVLESATSIARKIRNKEVTCTSVVNAFIERIKQVNADLNAVVDTRFKEAIEEAQALDEKIASGEEFKDKPFLGVPFTSKESTACKGLSYTFGLVARKDVKASEDAYIVERMKAAGAILIAVTNIPELLWIESRNLIYGQSNNPYSLCRTPGASSGGEASITSACGNAIGLGTDLGGSVRIPASYCGLFGHKITTGSINTRGIYGKSGKEGKTMLTAGPIVKFAEDLLPLTKCLVLPEKLPLLNLDKPVDLSKIKVYYVEDPGDMKVSPLSGEMIEAIRSCVRQLEEKCGNAAESLAHIEQFRQGFDLWKYWTFQETDNFNKLLFDFKDEAVWWKELIKFPLGMGSISFASLLKLLDNLIPPPAAQWAEEQTKIFQTKLKEALSDNGVLIFPSSPEPAPYHYSPFFRPFNFTYWAIFNIIDFPVTNVPLKKLSKSGLPLGVQVVASTNNDRLCIAVAKYLEDSSVCGWTPPFKG